MVHTGALSRVSFGWQWWASVVQFLQRSSIVEAEKNAREVMQVHTYICTAARPALRAPAAGGVRAFGRAFSRGGGCSRRTLSLRPRPTAEEMSSARQLVLESGLATCFHRPVQMQSWLVFGTFSTLAVERELRPLRWKGRTLA